MNRAGQDFSIIGFFVCSFQYVRFVTSIDGRSRGQKFLS